MNSTNLEKMSLSVVIPLFNSETTIGKLARNVHKEIIGKINSLEIILINDGSSDNTENEVEKVIKEFPNTIKYIALSKNFGEHNAVMCGLNHSTGDCVVIIDDDFQNPPEEILKLVSKISEGYDIVFSYYKQKKHSFFRNMGSRFNNWMATILLEKPNDLYLSSFKAINSSLVKEIIQYQGPFPYIDGILLQLTKNIGTVLCQHNEREDGESNYTLRKLVRLWLNMVTGFSITPLRVASWIGIFMSIFAALMVPFFIISYVTGGVLFKQTIPPGWASLIVAITFFGGLQLILIGIIGEYLGRLFLTVNRLPQYVIKNKVQIENEIVN
jgi:polyisoprenyl-phosphate glycosyltransferase